MKKSFLIAFILFYMIGCKPSPKDNQQNTGTGWKTEFNNLLPLLGHRNWILVVDKAFPMQNSQGITIINTGDQLVTVLQYVMDQLQASTHVKPVYYHDAEMKYLLPNQVPGLEGYRKTLDKILEGNETLPILHDSVFVKIDAASKLFKVVVLKTEETIPYSSVFIELGCKYWDAAMEKELRKRMEGK
jgi:hypothetical protein